mgnify:FL=1
MPLVFTILVLVFLVLNVIYFLKRSWEGSFVQSNYFSIYCPTEMPVIRKWKEEADGIRGLVRWKAPVEGWKITRDGEPYSECQGKDIFVPRPMNGDEPDNTAHDYLATPQPEGIGLPIDLKIWYFARKNNEERGLPRPDMYILYTSNPNAAFKQYPLSFWVDDYEYMKREHLEETDKIIKEKICIEEGDTTLGKLDKIMIHLRDELGQPCRGVPPMRFRWMDPYEIYVEMRDGTGTGWCTQQGQMFVYFANRAGLQTRWVQGARTQGNNFIFSGHVWPEAWIPEQERWAWMDSSYGIVCATDKKGKVLNSVEMARLRQHSAWDGVQVRTYKDWQWPDVEGEPNTIIQATFDEVAGIVERQFWPGLLFKWRRPPNVEDVRSRFFTLFKNRTYLAENFIRWWFRPSLAYSDYPNEGWKTYLVRHFLLWGLVGSTAGLVIA